MGNIVWVVQKCSDYEGCKVVAVFNMEEKAEKYAKDNRLYLEEYEIKELEVW